MTCPSAWRGDTWQGNLRAWSGDIKLCLRTFKFGNRELYTGPYCREPSIHTLKDPENLNLLIHFF